MRLDPAVAATRVAVRRVLETLPEAALVLVAASGGADSTALALACAFEASRGGRRAGLITVDHGLQPDSAQRAARLARWAGENGFDPVEIAAVRVEAGRQGPEGEARTARYTALAAAAERLEAAAILLGHTRDDQAETVLMRLARGSGCRSLAGIPASRGLYRRPFLALPRQLTGAACAAQGVEYWQDPHNADPAYTRSRVRAELLPVLSAVLGPAAVGGLVRTAELARDDADALDGWAQAHLRRPDPLSVEALGALPRAVRTRVLRAAAVQAGASPAQLSWAHASALERLVSDWRGQGPVQLPGGLTGRRLCGKLRIDVPALSAPGPLGAPRGGARRGQRGEHPQPVG